MEPMEINGGRFYVRPLHDDDRIDDRPALAAVFGAEVDPNFVSDAREAWATDTRYTWAVCEQTQVELLAFAELAVSQAGGTATLTVRPAGDEQRRLPNDPVLTPKTVGDAVAEGRATVRRWAENYLNLTVADATH